MSEETRRRRVRRDYSKTILPLFDHETFMKIATTEPTYYDAEKEAEKAVEYLRKQGFDV